LMKCIIQEAGIELLKEIHSGTCGNHVASWTLVDKIFPSRILLAVCCGWCREASTPLRWVLVFCKAYTCTSTWDLDHTSLLAFCMLGTGYDSAFQAGP
jgi:hypothetical protein